MPRILVVLLVALAGCATHVPDAQECDAASPGRPLCGLQNPEDVVALPGTPWLLASQFRRSGNPPGSIVAFTLDDPRATTVVGPTRPAERLEDPLLAKNAEICPGPLPPDGLAPHGIDLVVEEKPPWLLLVVNHGMRESIEIYDVTPADGAPRLRWVGCIPLPEGLTGNDVAAMPDGAFVVSGIRATTFAWALVRMALGLSLGDVLEWSPDHGWRHIDGTDVRMPNGVAVARDGRLFVADWAGHRLIRIDRTSGRRDEVGLPDLLPDNLTWDRAGDRLLVAGQRGSPRIAVGCVGSPGTELEFAL